MTATNKLRVATIDTARAIDTACLIIELRLGSETIHTLHPSQLASAVDTAAANVEVLSSWKASASPEPAHRHCLDVMGVGYKPLPQVALGVPSMMTCRRPSGIGPTPRGISPYPPSAVAKPLSDCLIGADTATDSRRMMRLRSSVDSRPNTGRAVGALVGLCHGRASCVERWSKATGLGVRSFRPPCK